MFLALFAIWLAFQQRKESQANYEHTKDVLSQIGKIMEKTELLVSDNFQKLLASVTDQQRQLLESLRPRPTQEEKYADLFIHLASQEPEKLDSVVNAIVKVTQAQPQQRTQADALTELLRLGQQMQRPEE